MTHTCKLEMTYGKWLVQWPSKIQANIHMHGCNEVTLVWGLLRLTSGVTTHCPCNLNHMITLLLPTAQEAPPTPPH